MPPDPSHVLLAKARDDDERLASLVAENPSVSNEQLGFLAQQAIEKAIKAVLAARRAPYRRTHDFTELLDLLRSHQVGYPDRLESCADLTPFATEMRYDSLPIEPDDSLFDRAAAMQLVRLALEWAEKIIG